MDVHRPEDALGRELARAARAVVAVGVLVRIPAQLLDEGLAVGRRKLRMHAQHVRCAGELDDGHIVVRRIRDLHRVGRHGDGSEPHGSERLPVGGRSHHLRHADRAAGTGYVDDDQGLLEKRLGALGEHAEVRVRAAAGRGGHDELDGVGEGKRRCAKEDRGNEDTHESHDRPLRLGSKPKTFAGVSVRITRRVAASGTHRSRSFTQSS